MQQLPTLKQAPQQRRDSATASQAGRPGAGAERTQPEKKPKKQPRSKRRKHGRTR